jgi:prepilin-type N-terminal cleavage/methylation domain-containing protein
MHCSDRPTGHESERESKRETEHESAPRAKSPSRTSRGYALMLVVVSTLLVVTASAIALAVAREGSIAAINETRAASAHAAATTGLQWMLTNLSSAGGKSAVVQAATASMGTATRVLPGPKNLYRFNPDAQYAGVPTTPPAVGTSTADWTAFGNGHFGLLGGIDPLDQTRSVLIRSIGVVGNSQIVLETNLQLTPTQNLPSGITGCFPSNFQMTFYDQEGPYDYTGNFRMDGTLGVPLAISADHDRINGLARTPDATITIAADATYRQGVRWRGQQNLRSTTPASGVSNIFGGTRSTNFFSDGTGPFTNWASNPYLSNDPRLVDLFDTADMRGLGLGPGGGLFTGVAGATLDTTSAGVIRQRGLPLIAVTSAPSAAATSAANGGFLGQSAWATAGDDSARKGFYGCFNAGGTDATLNDATNVCLHGGPAAGAGHPPRALTPARKERRPVDCSIGYARAMAWVVGSSAAQHRGRRLPRGSRQPRCCARQPRFRAFTLLELVVVVAVVGVLTTLAANSVGDRVRGARGREDLAAVVRPFIEARGRAHSALRCARVDVDGNAHTVAYTVGTCGSIPATPTRTFSFPWLSFGTFVGGASSITFNTRGGLTTTSLAELVVTTAGGETARLRVYPAIGQVELVR